MYVVSCVCVSLCECVGGGEQVPSSEAEMGDSPYSSTGKAPLSLTRNVHNCVAIVDVNMLNMPYIFQRCWVGYVLVVFFT